MEKYLKVEGSESLVRDSGSRAILSHNDNHEYEAWLTKRNVGKAQAEAVRKNSEDIQGLRDELKEVKDLLLRLIRER